MPCMKIRARTVARVFVALVGAVVLAVMCCCQTVDYTPYFLAPYYTQTVARLAELVRTNAAAEGQLEAGFGRSFLNPTLNAVPEDPANGRFRQVPLAGYGSRRGRPATGVHDDLCVKAVALRVGQTVGVMVGTDLLIVPREVTDQALAAIERELKLSRAQIYLSATHSHSSLGGWGEGKVAEGFAGPYQPGIRTWIAGRIVSAVREAVSDLKPAACGYGSFVAPEFVRNRLIGQLGQVDPGFTYLLLQQKEGRTAVLGSFGAHATVLSSGVMEFSGDYPGSWQRAIEAELPGFAVFMGGSVGSQSPVPGPGASGFAAAERMGQRLAQRALNEIASTPLTNFVHFEVRGLELTLPPLQTRLTDNIRLRSWLAGRLLPVHEQSFVQLFQLNNAVWISTPCDFSGELALQIKDFAKARGYLACVTSFNGDYIGYIIPPRYYHLSGYEPRLMSFYGPYMADYLESSIEAMFPGRPAGEGLTPHPDGRAGSAN